MRTNGYFPLPTEYKGRRVKPNGYLPYVLQADLTIDASTLGIPRAFQDGSFYHGAELPFWVARMHPTVITLDGSDANQADPNIGNILDLVQIQVKRLGSARELTPNPTRLRTLVEGDSLTWAWDAPIVLETKDALVIYGINNVPAASAAGGIRLSVALLGVLLDLE
jgi:hypothetical protein